MKKLIYVVTMTVLGVLCSISMDAQYKIVNYTDMNQINSLTEDGDYVWVSTSGGAFKRKKSDGSLVKVINTDNSGIQRNSVNTMFIDFFGNYWFGTNNGGISKFDGNTWTSYDYLDNTWVNYCEAITSDLNGDLWFGVNGGVLKYSNNTWKYFNFGPFRSVNSIIADDLGNIWASIAGVNGAGLWKINVDGVIENIPGPGNYFNPPAGDYSTGAPYCLEKDNENNIWMGGYGVSSLMKYNNNTSAWTLYNSLPTIYSMAKDNQGNIWLGTEIGVIKYNGITFSAAIGSGRTGFNENLVMDLMSDAQGNIWIGSYKGLAQLNQTTSAWTPPILLNALPSNFTETVVFDSNNKAFVYGQFDKTLTFDGSFWNSISNNSGTPFYWPKNVAIDNANNKYFAMPGSDKKLRLFKLNSSNNTTAYSHSDVLVYDYSQEVVKDIQYDPGTDRIWIATNQGLFTCKSNGTSWIRYMQTVGGLASNSLTAVAISGTRVWYSTGNSGIGYLDQSNSTWKTYTESDGLPWNTAGEMVFDKSGNLWLICSGLTKFNGTGFQNWYPAGISPTDIACDQNDNIWVGGYGGVSKFRDGTFRSYTTDDGLIEDAIGDVVIDRQNNVWLPTGYNGISKLIPQTPSADFSTNTACLPGASVLSNLSVKTDALTTYKWDIYNDGTVDFTTRDAEIVFPSKGIYDVKLTVMNDDLTSEIVKQVTVLESPNLSLNIEGDYKMCFGESQDVQVIINNQDPLLAYQVEWSNGITGTQQIWASEEGDYIANVNNGQCETQSPALNLSLSKPYSDEKICMVTVDVETGKNLIVWEKTADAGISSYNVFKLFGNSYVPIGNVSALDISVYIDYTSTPEALASRYAISAIDTCGNESPKSAYHQTIQLGASIGSDKNSIVLDWTNYIDESKIWQPEFYNIYRGNDPSNMELIKTVSSAFTEWNDMNPGNNRYYQVSVEKVNPCDPAGLLGKKTSSGPFVHSLSNLEDNRLQSTGISNFNSYNSVQIFPNPMKTESRISWDNKDGSNYELFIYDLKGTVIRSVSGLNSNEYILQRENLNSGFYLIELRGRETYRARLLVD